MAFIESFLLYLLIISTVFLLISIPVVLIVLIQSYFGGFSKREYLKKILKSKFILLLCVLYFSFFGLFYINQSFTYYGDKRSYPQAKSFAIVGNTIYLFHSILLSLNINYPESSLDKRFINIQNYILKKIYEYIPENDAERDIWLYKFKFNYIIKLRYAPVIKKYKEKEYQFMLMEMNQVTYSPDIISIMDTLHNISNNLIYKKIEDKIFNKKNKYLIISQMSYYLTNKMSVYASIYKMSYVEKVKLFLNNEKLVKKLINYNNLLELVYKLQRDDKEINNIFEEFPLYKSILLSSLVNNLERILFYKIFKNIYPCDTNEIKAYVKYHKEFYNWINSKSVYKNLSLKEKKRINFLKRVFFEQKESFYAISKYICNIPFKYQIPIENHYDKESKKYKFFLEKDEYLLDFTSSKSELFQIEKLKKQTISED